MANTNIWGPAQWTALHSYAACYKKKNKDAFKKYVYALTEIMPCSICRNHFKENLKIHPIENFNDNNETMLYWTYLLHDLVNISKGKKSPPFLVIKQKYLS
jgi:hypothetical protein